MSNDPRLDYMKANNIDSTYEIDEIMSKAILKGWRVDDFEATLIGYYHLRLGNINGVRDQLLILANSLVEFLNNSGAYGVYHKPWQQGIKINIDWTRSYGD